MLLQFDVIVSSTIRRKKPWPRLEWIGKEKESVCLLGRRRTSVLYLPSGRTKRVIRAFKPYMKDVVCFNKCSSGEFMVALLSSGKIVRWHKDSNEVLVIPSCPGINLFGGKDDGKENIFVSNDGIRIIAIVNFHKVNVWEQNTKIHTSPDDLGEWSTVDIGLGPLKSVAFKETVVDAMFFTNQDQGSCCLVTFVCNNTGRLTVCNMLLHWPEQDPPVGPDCSDFFSSTSYHTFPLEELQPTCKSIRIRGAFLVRISHDGHTVAVAVNQRHPHQSHIMFVHPYTATSLAVDLKGLGSKNRNVLSQFAKTYWIADMVWTYDDLFLACVTGRGSVMVLSKLGEPMLLATHKLSVEFGPAFFIPLHPLIEHDKKKSQHPHQSNPAPRPGSPNSIASSIVSERSWRQRLSITAHPRLPILLCSDGYGVTALQITEWVRPRDVATLSLVEANRDLKKIIKKFKLEATPMTTPRYKQPVLMQDRAKFKEHILTRIYAAMFKKKQSDKKPLSQTQNLPEESFSKDEDIKKLKYQFEEEEKELSDTIVQESFDEDEDKENAKKPSGAVLDADEGKINFADLDLSLEPHHLLDESEPLDNVDGETLLRATKRCVTRVLSTWGLIVSEGFVYEDASALDSPKKDELHAYFIRTLSLLCGVLLESQRLAQCLPWSLQDGHHHDNTSEYLRTSMCDAVILLAEKLSLLSSWDRRHLPLVNDTMRIIVKTVLVCNRSAPEGCSSVQEILENVSAAFSLLTRTEKFMYQIYSYHKVGMQADNLDPTSHCKYISLDVAPMQVPSIYSRRLMMLPVWKLFYSFVTDIYTYETSVQGHPLINEVLSVLQRMLLAAVAQNDLESGRELSVLRDMVRLVADYKLSQALDSALLALQENQTIFEEGNDERWFSVELVCNVMVAYFTDAQMKFSYVDSPQQYFALERELMTRAVRSEKLSYSWSASQAAAMLLGCGRIREASVFARDLGDWKAATVLSAVAEKVRAFCGAAVEVPSLAGCTEQMSGTKVLEILQDRFLTLLPTSLAETDDAVGDETPLSEFDPESLFPEFTDLFIVGVMTACDLSSWVAKFILGRLKAALRQLSFLVSDKIYLPAPPPYLPQPFPDETVAEESFTVIRQKVSSLIRLALVAFHAIGITRHAASWYVKKLENARPSTPLSSASENLTTETPELSLDDEGCRTLLSAFRDSFAVLWVLRVREQVTVHVRAYQALREKGQDCSDAIWESFKWLEKLKPFTSFMNCESEMQDLVLCLASALPVNFDLASVLAKFFPDPVNVDPKVDTRFKQVLSKLRQTSIPAVPAPPSEQGDHETTLEDLGDPTPIDGQLTLQPMTVVYQRQCRVEAQKQEREIAHVFMKKTTTLRPGTSTSSCSLALLESNDILQALDTAYPFESDQLYHEFVSQLFDVILDKSASLTTYSSAAKKASSRRHAAPEQVLVLANRYQIALTELELAAKSRDPNPKKFSSRFEKDSFAKPDHVSTPKASIKKASSVGDVMRTVRHLSFVEPSSDDISGVHAHELRRYFSQSELGAHHLLHDSRQALPKCPTMKISDAPASMRKRLHRLSSYARWLQHWADTDYPGAGRQKPAIRLQIDQQQLLGALAVAELRFGKQTFAKSGVNSEVDKSEAKTEVTAVSQDIDDVTTVSSLAESNHHSVNKSDAAISKVVGEHLLNTADEVDGVTSGSSEVTEGSIENASRTLEQLPEGNVSADGANQEGEDLAVKEDEQDEKDSTLLAEELARQTSELISDDVSSAQADGCGRVTGLPPQAIEPSSRGPLTTQPSANQNVADVVRSEIHNVLLAQQVSLLSQILLGQTMLGGGQGPGQAAATNPIMSGVLQTLLPGLHQTAAAQQSAQVPVASREPEPALQPPEEQHGQSQRFDVGPPNGRPRPQTKFSIPLFHVSGITKSQDPKKAALLKTPESQRAWTASASAKMSRHETETSSPPKPSSLRLINFTSPGKPLRMQDLRSFPPPNDSATRESAVRSSHPPPLQHNLEQYTHYPKLETPSVPPVAPRQHSAEQYQRQSPYEIPTEQPAVAGQPLLKLPPTVSLNKQAYVPRVPGPAGAHKTRFPILLTHEMAPPAAPQFAAPRPREAWSDHGQRATLFERFREVPVVPPQRSAVIPRLIDPREVLAYERQKQGFQCVKQERSHRPPKPSVPILKVKAPPFERSTKIPPVEPEPAWERAEDKENVKPVVSEKTSVSEEKLPSSQGPKPARRGARPAGATVKSAQEDASLAFEGYLKQEDINHEVTSVGIGISDETMTPSDAHFVASVGKQAQTKPRMKNVQLQAIVEDESDKASEIEALDYRDQLTTKPLKPPPDIFLRLRLEAEKPIVDDPDTHQRSGFLHMGDVSAESVKRGLSPKKTAAELHYRVASELQPELTSYAPGFPNDPPSREEKVTVESILSSHVKEVTKVKRIRDVTRERHTSALEQMSAQIDAMDAMARNMREDFKSAASLVKTIDTLGDVLETPSQPAPRRRSSRRSPSPVSEESSSHRDVVAPRVTRTDRSHYDVAAARPEVDPTIPEYPVYEPKESDYYIPAYQPLPEPSVARTTVDVSGDFKTSSSRYRERLNEAYRLSAAPHDELRSDRSDRMSTSSSALSLHSKQEDPVDPHMMLYESPTLPEDIHTIPEEVETSTDSSVDVNVAESEYALKQERLVRNLIEDKPDSTQKIKSWSQRTEKDRRDVRRWMTTKQRERSANYQARLKTMREAEKQPFNATGSSTKKMTMKEMNDLREKKRNEMLASHHNVRVNASVKLMGELKMDKPELPSPDATRVKKKQDKASASRRSPLKEANGRLDTTFRVEKRPAPYKKKRSTEIEPRKKQTRSGKRSSTETEPVSDASSIMSTWQLSDDIKRILYDSMESSKRHNVHVTFDLGDKNSTLPDDSALSLPPDNDDDSRSRGTESLLADVDWNDVDAMLSSVDHD